MKKRASSLSSTLPERGRHIEKRWLAYALAVGGTALVTAPANAEVVYTPAHISGFKGTIFVDLNNDGISDFTLNNVCNPCTSSVQIKELDVQAAENPSVHVIGRNGSFPQGTVWPAPYGFSIGPNSPQKFIGPLRIRSGPFMAGYDLPPFSFPFGFDGPWQNVSDKYLGIQFSINGQTHYGWARLTVRTFLDSKTNYPEIEVQLTGYAYETQPNTAILAGDEGPKAKPVATDASGGHSPSLGLLGLGSMGLDVWRPYKQGPTAH